MHQNFPATWLYRVDTEIREIDLKHYFVTTRYTEKYFFLMSKVKMNKRPIKFCKMHTLLRISQWIHLILNMTPKNGPFRPIWCQSRFHVSKWNNLGQWVLIWHTVGYLHHNNKSTLFGKSFTPYLLLVSIKRINYIEVSRGNPQAKIANVKLIPGL